MKDQSFGSQLWDATFCFQALFTSELGEEIRPALAKSYDFIKKSQVGDNPLDNFRGMYRHISNQDHGSQLSDCTAEALKCVLLAAMLPSEFVGHEKIKESLSAKTR